MKILQIALTVFLSWVFYIFLNAFEALVNFCLHVGFKMVKLCLVLFAPTMCVNVNLYMIKLIFSKAEVYNITLTSLQVVFILYTIFVFVFPILVCYLDQHVSESSSATYLNCAIAQKRDLHKIVKSVLQNVKISSQLDEH